MRVTTIGSFPNPLFGVSLIFFVLFQSYVYVSLDSGEFLFFNQYGGVSILEGRLCGPGVGVAGAIQAEEFRPIFSSHFDEKFRGIQNVQELYTQLKPRYYIRWRSMSRSIGTVVAFALREGDAL